MRTKRMMPWLLPALTVLTLFWLSTAQLGCSQDTTAATETFESPTAIAQTEDLSIPTSDLNTGLTQAGSACGMTCTVQMQDGCPASCSLRCANADSPVSGNKCQGPCAEKCQGPCSGVCGKTGEGGACSSHTVQCGAHHK